MINLYENNTKVNLMIWETDVKLRNKNNAVKLYIEENEELSVGDYIMTNYDTKGFSTYEVLEILERRKGSIEGKDYITCKTRFKHAPLDWGGFNLFVSIRFQKYFNLIE